MRDNVQKTAQNIAPGPRSGLVTRRIPVRLPVVITRLPVPLGPLIGESLANHLEKSSLVNPDVTTAGTVQSLVTFIGIVVFVYSRLVAAQQLSLTYLVISEQFFSTGGTT